MIYHQILIQLDDYAEESELQDGVNAFMAAAHYESLPSRPDLKTALLASKRRGAQFPQDILGLRCHELREFLGENNCYRDAADFDDIYQSAKRGIRSSMGPIRVEAFPACAAAPASNASSSYLHKFKQPLRLASEAIITQPSAEDEIGRAHV